MQPYSRSLQILIRARPLSWTLSVTRPAPITVLFLHRYLVSNSHCDTAETPEVDRHVTPSSSLL